MASLAVAAAILLLAWTILRKYKLGKSAKFNQRLIPPDTPTSSFDSRTSGSFWPTEDELVRRRQSAEAMGDGALVRGS